MAILFREIFASKARKTGKKDEFYLTKNYSRPSSNVPCSRRDLTWTIDCAWTVSREELTESADNHPYNYVNNIIVFKYNYIGLCP